MPPMTPTSIVLLLLLIMNSRCGDSDLTPGLTGSSVGSLATRESAPQPPPASSILLLNPLPLLLLLIQSFFQNLLLFLSKRPACCQSPSFAKSLSPIYNLHSSLLSCQIAQHHVLQGRCSYCGGNRDLIAKWEGWQVKYVGFRFRHQQADTPQRLGKDSNADPGRHC